MAARSRGVEVGCNTEINNSKYIQSFASFELAADGCMLIVYKNRRGAKGVRHGSVVDVQVRMAGNYRQQ